MEEKKPRYDISQHEGKRFSRDYQPSKEARSKAASKVWTTKRAIKALKEIEARKLGIATDLLFSRETSRTIIESVTERLPLSPEEVTAYHGVLLRLVVEAQNGNVNSAMALRQELTSARDYLQARQDKEENGNDGQFIINVREY